MTDPAPETPILPEDAPLGIPPVILIEIPIGVDIIPHPLVLPDTLPKLDDIKPDKTGDIQKPDK